MRLLFVSALFLAISLNFSFAQDYQTQKEIPRKVIEHFETHKTEAIYALFNDTMKAAITKDKLAEIWNSLPLQCGAYLGYGESVASEVQGMIVVNQLLDFETIDLDIRLAFDTENQISGLFFVQPVKKK